jgi:hypothetical protein
MLGHWLRSADLHSIEVHALRWYARERLILPLAHRPKLLKITEIVLRSWRRNNSDDLKGGASIPIYRAFPVLCVSIVLDRCSARRPNIPSLFVLGQKPDFLTLGKSLQRSTHSVTDSFALRFSILKQFAGARVGYLYLPATQATGTRRYRRPYRIARNSRRYRVHKQALQHKPFSPSVVSLSSPSRTRRARAQARLPIFGGDRAACQTGPIRRGLLTRRFPLRGTGNNFRRIA